MQYIILPWKSPKSRHFEGVFTPLLAAATTIYTKVEAVTTQVFNDRLRFKRGEPLLNIHWVE